MSNLIIIDGSQLNQTMPTLADTVQFVLKTPGADGCFYQNPYEVKNATVYFIARDFTSGNFFEYDQKHYDQTKLQTAIDAEKYACDYPTDENIIKAQNVRAIAEASVVTTPFYYNESVPVVKFGDDQNPAWLDPTRSYVNIEDNILTNTGIGTFTLDWEPKGMREGQYYICWTWKPNPAGDSISDNYYFEISGATQLSALPQHVTNPKKYYDILTRYTPEMFKTRIGSTDLAPKTIDSFNKSIASGFIVIEDLSNQIIDLLDANYTNESFLPLLANMFNLHLRSQDPTLWRRQIKRAVPLYKKKGTLNGLKEAYAESGFNLLKITQLWQVVSRYTWAEALSVELNGQTQFILSKNPILEIDKVDSNNFELYYREKGTLVDGYWTTDFIPLTQDYVSFSTTDQITAMTWLGNSQPIPIVLAAGDNLKVIYKVRDIPAENQTIEDYIRGLQLADQRDDRDQEYPLKNWNVRVIEEDDIMISAVIPTRHPYENSVVFGQVRTEFPLSENVYNMDEYDGSIRDSKKPCDIDKNFLDCCTACLSSKFNIDLEIQDLCNDRLVEAYNILEEYKPFHAILHSMRFQGLVDEFVNCNVESVESLVTVTGEENVLADVGQIFSRVMQHAHSPGDDRNAIKRNMLNDLTNETGAGVSGTVSSQEIVLYAPNVELSNLNINNWEYIQNPTTYVAGSNQNILEILAPHFNSGEYVLSGNIGKHIAKIDSPPDPFDSSGFTFRISNFIYNNVTSNIDPFDATMGIVTIIDGSINDVRNLLKIGDYVRIGIDWHKLVGFVDGETHKFYIEYTGASLGATINVYRRLTDNQIGYMDYNGIKLVLAGNYETSLGIINGASAPNYPFPRGFLNEGSGNLNDTDDDHFKENFMISINGQYFTIEDINGNFPAGFTTFILNGIKQMWTTTGTVETASIYRATKKPFLVPEQVHLKEVKVIKVVDPNTNEILGQQYIPSVWTWPAFDYSELAGNPLPGQATIGIDRRGKDLVSSQEETVVPMTFRTSVLNALNKNQVVDAINQQESVSFNITWAEGSEEGKYD